MKCFWSIEDYLLVNQAKISVLWIG